MKKNRAWAMVNDSGTITNATPLGQSSIFSLPDGQVQEGTAWLNRFVGSYAARLTGIVAGAEGLLDVWHGLVQVDTESVLGSHSILDNSDDNAAWLYREPILLFPCGRHAGAGTDYTVSGRIDWAIRGGNGTRIRLGCDILYVIEGQKLTGVTSVDWRYTCLSLYSGT